MFTAFLRMARASVAFTKPSKLGSPKGMASKIFTERVAVKLPFVITRGRTFSSMRPSERVNSWVLDLVPSLNSWYTVKSSLDMECPERMQGKATVASMPVCNAISFNSLV